MDNSYWISSTENVRKKYPKLQEEIETEITIIGAGLTGITTGYYLSKIKKDVVILEKNRICESTTGNTTGKITSQHGLFYYYLIESQGKEYAMQYLFANEKAIENISRIVEKENIDCDFEWQDAYVFAQTEEKLEEIKKEQKALEYLGFKNSKLVDRIEVPIKNKNVIGALKFRNQAQFNACKYGLGLAKCIEDAKGKIYENSKVIDIKKEENFYIVKTEEGVVKSKIVIIASHFPIVDVPGFYFVKMYQATSYLIAVETKSKLFDGMYISADNNKISLRTAKYGDKRIVLIGGSSHKTGAKVNLKNSFKELENIANEMFPGSKVLCKWNAEDCISLDKIPYIGEFSNFWQNVYIGTGYNKWGMTSSNVAANIIKDKILGIENPYEEVFISTRLKPIKNYKELGNMLKEVTYSEVINKLKDIGEHTKDVKQGEGKIVEIAGKKVGVYRNKEGKLYVVKPYCSHLGCELSWNNLENTWDCPCHGSRFDIYRKINT